MLLNEPQIQVSLTSPYNKDIQLECTQMTVLTYTIADDNIVTRIADPEDLQRTVHIK